MISEKKTENFLEYIPVTNFNWRISEETKKVIVERILVYIFAPAKENSDTIISNFGMDF